MNAARPVSAVLADALAGAGDARRANDWRLLAFYSWDTDQQQVIAKDELPATLLALADACPADAAETAMRLRLKALAAADAKTPAAGRRGDARGRARAARPTRRARASRPTCSTNYAAEIVRALSAKGIGRARAARWPPSTPR